jgi:hypothetical protein
MPSRFHGPKNTGESNMAEQEFSGDALVQALEKGELTPPAAAGTALVGMVKRSDLPGCLSFTPAGCDTWVDMPTSMIEKAVHLGQRRCKDHSHPVVRITLKQPADAEGQLLAKLLMALSRRSGEDNRPLQPRGRMMPARAAQRAPTGGSLGEGFDCDEICQLLLKGCIEDTPFSSEFCVFLYSTCFRTCGVFGGVFGPIIE